jgi:hypothetical protein
VSSQAEGRPIHPVPAKGSTLKVGGLRLRRGEPRPHRGRRGFLAGVLLMAGSFLVYPAYPLLVFFPSTDRARVEVTLVAAALSWAVFSVGLYLAGRRGWVWLRRRWKGRSTRAAPPPPAPPP